VGLVIDDVLVLTGGTIAMCAVMRRDHILAKRSFVRAADVARHKLIATPTGAMREDLENLFHSEGGRASPAIYRQLRRSWLPPAVADRCHHDHRSPGAAGH